MKIQYWSDLHLEFAENAKYMMDRHIEVVGDVLILAGDITYWDEQHFLHPFFDKVSRKFKQVYLIPGNHEFYGGFDISILEKPIHFNIRDNVFIVNIGTESIGDVEFFFTTLWAKISPQNAFYVEQKVNDFHLIKYNGETLTAKDFNQLYSLSRSFLENAIKESTSLKKVVVTHHCPTQMSIPKEFWNSQINNAFVIELYDFIYHNPIDYWIFGHTHRNEAEVNINRTKVISNQLGYVNWGEHKTFKINTYIEL